MQNLSNSGFSLIGALTGLLGLSSNNARSLHISELAKNLDSATPDQKHTALMPLFGEFASMAVRKEVTQVTKALGTVVPSLIRELDHPESKARLMAISTLAMIGTQRTKWDSTIAENLRKAGEKDPDPSNKSLALFWANNTSKPENQRGRPSGA